MERRKFLIGGTLLGCSAAASPFVTPVAMAAAPWDARLVVVILRGAMDGLDVIQPYGDPDLAGLRPTLLTGEAGEATDLDGFYALNRHFSPLMPLWDAGQFGAVHAVSTPYRDKRSHFDGQDILEAGLPDLSGGGLRDGWLNRMLQVVPGLEPEVAFAIGREQMLVLAGDAPASRWSPDARLQIVAFAWRYADCVVFDQRLGHPRAPGQHIGTRRTRVERYNFDAARGAWAGLGQDGGAVFDGIWPDRAGKRKPWHGPRDRRRDAICGRCVARGAGDWRMARVGRGRPL